MKERHEPGQEELAPFSSTPALFGNCSTDSARLEGPPVGSEASESGRASRGTVMGSGSNEPPCGGGGQSPLGRRKM